MESSEDQATLAPQLARFPGTHGCCVSSLSSSSPPPDHYCLQDVPSSSESILGAEHLAEALSCNLVLQLTQQLSSLFCRMLCSCLHHTLNRSPGSELFSEQ